MTSKIFLRFALWVGSDKPTPRGGGGEVLLSSSPMADDMSGVVAKELIDEDEDVLRGVGDI